MMGSQGLLRRGAQVAMRFFAGPPGFAPLNLGERYVCVVGSGGVSRLMELTLLAQETWTDTTALPGEGSVYTRGDDATLVDDDGVRYLLRRYDVLWPAATHAAVAAAACRVGQPLVPTQRRPVPSWRVGRAVVDLESMVTLGGLLPHPD